MTWIVIYQTKTKSSSCLDFSQLHFRNNIWQEWQTCWDFVGVKNMLLPFEPICIPSTCYFSVRSRPLAVTSTMTKENLARTPWAVKKINKHTQLSCSWVYSFISSVCEVEMSMHIMWLTIYRNCNDSEWKDFLSWWLLHEIACTYLNKCQPWDACNEISYVIRCIYTNVFNNN